MKIVFCIFVSCLILLASCNSKSSEFDKHAPVFLGCDSIVYELPTETIDSLCRILEGKNVRYCKLSIDDSRDTYGFIFRYVESGLFSEKDSILVRKTNRYLKVRDNFYPIVYSTDQLFASQPLDEVIDDSAYGFIVVDKEGLLQKKGEYNLY